MHASQVHQNSCPDMLMLCIVYSVLGPLIEYSNGLLVGLVIYFCLKLGHM